MKWLLPEDFAILRRIFYAALPYVDKHKVQDLPIDGPEYLELFFISCDAIDRNRQLTYEYRRRLKKLALIVISKISRDNAYQAMIRDILEGIQNMEVRI